MKEQLKRLVFKEFGLHSKKPSWKTTNPEIHKMLHPYEGKLDTAKKRLEALNSEKYPLIQAGDFSRLPWEFLPNWVDLGKINEILLKNPKIAKIVRNTSNGGTLLEKYRDEALKWRAIKEYSHEWNTATPEMIKKAVVEPAGGIPAKANELNAEVVAEKIRKKIRQNKELKLLDVGTGGGGTVLPIVEKLNPNERKKIKIILLDVMKEGLKETKRKLLGLGLDKEQIITLNANFLELGLPKMPGKKFDVLEKIRRILRRKKIKRLVGNVDFVVSGAALHHVSDNAPLFSALYRILKPGGEIHFFDWGHYARMKPEMNLSKLEEPVEGITRGLAPLKSHTVLAMNSTWLSLLQYSAKAKEKLVNEMKEKIKRKESFNFLKWLEENRGRIQRELKPIPKNAPPLFIEGHRPLKMYLKNMRKVGFKIIDAYYPLITKKTKPSDVENLLFLIRAKKPK